MPLHLCRLLLRWGGWPTPRPSFVPCVTFLLAPLTFLTSSPDFLPFLTPVDGGGSPPDLSRTRCVPPSPSGPMQKRACLPPSAEPPPMPHTRASSRGRLRCLGLQLPWRATAVPPGGCRRRRRLAASLVGCSRWGTLDGFSDTIHVSRRDGAMLARRRPRSLVAPPPAPRPTIPRENERRCQVVAMTPRRPICLTPTSCTPHASVHTHDGSRSGAPGCICHGLRVRECVPRTW